MAVPLLPGAGEPAAAAWAGNPSPDGDDGDDEDADLALACPAVAARPTAAPTPGSGPRQVRDRTSRPDGLPLARALRSSPHDPSAAGRVPLRC